MRLDNIPQTPLDRLPYRVFDASGAPVLAHFAPLVPSDRLELESSPWTAAVYRDAWPDFTGHPKARKLMHRDGEILGVLALGIVQLGASFLRKSALEAKPTCRFSDQNQNRRFRGVGRVLVARLVAESYTEQTNGWLRVRSHPGAVTFYEKIGFVKTGRPYFYDLRNGAERRLFEEATGELP